MAQTWLSRNWWPLCIFTAALLVRVHWNLIAHPIGEFLYSDMSGYELRADQLLDDPLKPHEYAAFFPYGTTFLIAGVKLLFGRDAMEAIGGAFALMGAANALLMFLIARRVSPERRVAPAVGLLGVVYYPSIAIAGYMLSEGPASFFLTLSTWLLLRLVDHGRARDAWLLGLAVGLGATIRPQILLGIPLFGLFWLLARRHLPNLTLRRLVPVAIPIAVVLLFSAFRLHYHTGRIGLISENGPINEVFGHCHNKGIYSMPDGKGHGTVRFAPPALIQLERWSGDHPDSWIQLDPVWGADPSPVEGVPGFRVDSHGCRKRKCYVAGSEVQYAGYIGDRELQGRLVRECVRRGGWLKQLRYAATHVVMMWGYNSMWPDQANPKPRTVDPAWRWRVLSDRWKLWHQWLFMVPALAGLAFVFFPRRFARQGIVALNMWAVLAVAVLYLGGIRFRVPYDPLILVLAFQTYAVVGGWIAARIRARRGRSNRTS